MKHHLHLLLAAGFGAMSMGAAAAVHDWTATRIGTFDADILAAVDMNNAGQVAVARNFSEEGPAHLPLHPGRLGRACRSRLLRRQQNGAQGAQRER